MSLPYESATAGDRALLELQKSLAKFGCASFGTMTDTERSMQIVAFRWRGRQVQIEASWKGYATAWIKAHPWKWTSKCSKLQHEDRATQQARVSVCSVLRDWIKGQVTAVECGIMSFEEAFFAHMLTNNGMRVIERAREAQMLPMLEGPKE